MKESWEPPMFGPGDDDYGRDNFEEDWICPDCGNIIVMTRLNKRIGYITCPRCGYKNEAAIEVEKMFEKLSLFTKN